MEKKITLPTNEFILKFEMFNGLIDSIYMEMKEFAKKKPDDPINKFKVGNINRVLIQLKDLLKDEPTSSFLDLLDEDSLPTNSDTIIIIGQFKASIETFRKKNTNQYRRWKTVEYPEGKNNG